MVVLIQMNSLSLQDIIANPQEDSNLHYGLANQDFQRFQSQTLQRAISWEI